ncbi:serine/threonine protein phosphatase, partial [Streptomyces sp. NPDC059556]
MNDGNGRRRVVRRASAGKGASVLRSAGVRRRLGRSDGDVPLDRVTTRDRLAWLNSAGSRIGTTLDLERTAQELAEFIVPTLAVGGAGREHGCGRAGAVGSRWAGSGVPRAVGFK